MSNAYDHEVFERTLTDSEEFTIPIKSVQRYEVNDLNMGSYASSQIKFSLQQLATSSSYIDWKKSHLVIPLTLRVQSSIANGILGQNQMAAFYATLKSSFTSILDSLVVSINNVEVVSRQGSLANIPMYFNLLTQFERADVEATGSSFGFFPDSVESYSYSGVGGEVNSSLGNTLTASLNPSTAVNSGRVMRHYKTVASLLDGVTNTFFSAARMNTSHKSYCDATAATNDMNTYIEAVIPLRFIHSLFDNLPLCRGASIQMLFNVHCPSEFSHTVDATGVAITAATSKSPNNFIPFLVSNPNTTINSAAVQTITTSLRIGNIWGSPCQLRLNLCELNPEFEAKLLKSPTRKVVYSDYYCFANQVTNVAAGSSVNQTLTVNISKLRKLLIVPKIATNGNFANIADVYTSAFSSAGCTTTPQLLTNLQVFLSGKPVYQTPLQYSWEQFLLELDGGNQTLNGNIDNGLRCGLIDKAGFESIYGFFCVNLSRKDTADDVIEKAIQISFTNNNVVSMSYSIYIEYERNFDLDCISGRISV